MKNKLNNKGQALVTLVFFTLIGLTVATAAIVVTLTSTIAAGKVQSGTLTFEEAESGAENAYLKLLRNPNYMGETMTINNASVTITVTGTSPVIITSRAVSGNFARAVEIRLTRTNGKYSVQSWKEIF